MSWITLIKRVELGERIERSANRLKQLQAMGAVALVIELEQHHLNRLIERERQEIATAHSERRQARRRVAA